MRKLLLASLLLLPSAALAQSVRYQSIALSSRGTPLSNQNVAVCTQPANTNTQPCSPLATLATSTSTTSGGANPLTTDSNGNFFFYAAPGRYTVQIYGPQVGTQFVQADTVLACDPTGACDFTSSPSFKIPVGPSLDPTGQGGLSYDSTIQRLKYFGSGVTIVAIPTSADTFRAKQYISDQGTPCTNGELALSAGWQSTGSATVTAVAGTGQTCSWTITTGTTTAANPTITDTLTNPLPSANTVCYMNIYGGTHTAVAGESLRQTTLSSTAPVFTANFTPTAGGTTYFVTRTCGP